MSRADAIAAAGRGFAIFPIEPGKKEATLKGWPDKTCSDPRVVARYWPSDRHNIGVVAGKSGLVVIDLDTHGTIPDDWQLPGVTDGRDVLALICEWAGMDFPLGETYTVKTASGGWHLYYRVPEGSRFTNSVSVLGPCVDVKVNNGYVVGAGSRTAAGEYEVLYDKPVQPLPPWIARLLAQPEPETHPHPGPVTASGPGRVAGLVRTVERAKPGERNNTLFWAACTMAENSPGDMDQLQAAAARAGLDEREVNRTIWSARLRVGAL